MANGRARHCHGGICNGRILSRILQEGVVVNQHNGIKAAISRICTGRANINLAAEPTHMLMLMYTLLIISVITLHTTGSQQNHAALHACLKIEQGMKLTVRVRGLISWLMLLPTLASNADDN